MTVCRVLLLAVLIGCAGGEQTADVSWLINENTGEVMGLVGRGATAGSTQAHRFVLLECASYDLFIAASESYQRQAKTGKDVSVPRGCKELVAAELDREQLKASKKEMAAKLAKEKSIAGLLNSLSDGLNSGAVFSMLGISGKHTKILTRVVDKLKGLSVLPKIPGQNKIKKGLVVLSTVAMLVTSSGLLRRKQHEHYQVVLNELSGAEYRHRLQDQEASQEGYEEIKQLLTALVDEKGSQQSAPVQQKAENKLPRVVAN